MKIEIGPYPQEPSWLERKISIRIDKYDTWNMDSTLALIIHPMLVQLKATKHGSPKVLDEDVPDNLKSTSAPPRENDWDTDEYWHLRWEWVLEEMIWGFEQLTKDDHDGQFYDHSVPGVKNLKVDDIGLELHHNRIRNATRLFGVYFQGLWD